MPGASTASSPLQLFLPDSALAPAPRPTAASQPRAGAACAFGWGTRRGSALVVIGVVRAESAQHAAQLVAERCAGRIADGQPVEVLVELGSGEGGRGPAGIVLLDGEHRLSSSTSSGDSHAEAPLVVLYTPLKQLELLSLEPLRLGFQPRVEEVKDASAARASSAQGEGLSGAVAVVRPLFPLRIQTHPLAVPADVDHLHRRRSMARASSFKSGPALRPLEQCRSSTAPARSPSPSRASSTPSCRSSWPPSPSACRSSARSRSSRASVRRALPLSPCLRRPCAVADSPGRTARRWSARDAHVAGPVARADLQLVPPRPVHPLDGRGTLRRRSCQLHPVRHAPLSQALTRDELALTL